MPDDLDSTLATVGPHLRALRQQRNITLTDLAEETDISVSTLSRLESGTRKPTLELLLPLAQAYGVSLDELVDAPATGDPRVQLRPVDRHGMTMIPLTRRAGEIQAYKLILKPPRTDPEPQSHEGYEWLYVLDGRVRLILAPPGQERHDLVLAPGEAAEFDTRTPHAFVATDGPAEVLSLFGKQGERAHLRARPRRSG